MSYAPQPAYPPNAPYGQPPGYGGWPYPRRPSTAPAYLSAGLFVCCSGLSFLLAIIGWDGSAESQEALAAVIGVAFTEDLTGNIDFAIAATMTVACTVLTFAVVLLFRLDFVRWILGFVGGIVTGYYIYAVIWLLSHDAGKVISLALVALLLWLAATIFAVIPPTGRAMRGFQKRFGPPMPPMPQPGGYGHY